MVSGCMLLFSASVASGKTSCLLPKVGSTFKGKNLLLEEQILSF